MPLNPINKITVDAATAHIFHHLFYRFNLSRAPHKHMQNNERCRQIERNIIQANYYANAEMRSEKICSFHVIRAFILSLARLRPHKSTLLYMRSAHKSRWTSHSVHISVAGVPTVNLFGISTQVVLNFLFVLICGHHLSCVSTHLRRD